MHIPKAIYATPIAPTVRAMLIDAVSRGSYPTSNCQRPRDRLRLEAELEQLRCIYASATNRPVG